MCAKIARKTQNTNPPMQARYQQYNIVLSKWLDSNNTLLCDGNSCNSLSFKSKLFSGGIRSYCNIISVNLHKNSGSTTVYIVFDFPYKV